MVIHKMPGEGGPEEIEAQKLFTPETGGSQLEAKNIPDMQEGGKIEKVVTQSFREEKEGSRLNPVKDYYAGLEQKQIDQLSSLQLPTDSNTRELLQKYSVMMGYKDYQEFLDYLSGMDKEGKFGGFPPMLEDLKKTFNVDRSIPGLTAQQMEGVRGMYLSYMYKEFPNTAMGASIEGMNTLIGNQAESIKKEMMKETENFVNVFGKYYENVNVTANLSSEALLAGTVAGEE